MFVTANGTRQRCDVLSGGSYLSSSDQRLHFGLGPATAVEDAEVHWPSGAIEKLHVTRIDRIFTVEEGRGITGELRPQARKA